MAMTKETMVEQDPNELPVEFVPSENDVICGWARQNYHHAGNRMLRDLIQEYVPRYRSSSTKTEKGHVIIDIVERIRRDSPSGVGLVRQNKKTGRWSYIGLEKAKDKIGHALRKASSEKSKNLSKERTPRNQQYASTDSLTTLSTSPSPTPVSSASAPSSPATQNGRYEDSAPGPYHHQYDESYQRAVYHHPYHQYAGYHSQYPATAPPPGGHGTNYDRSSAHHGYDVYYPYPGAHSYPPAEYSYPPQVETHSSHHSSSPHHHHQPQPHHHEPDYPSSSYHGGESRLYSPVSHSASPVSDGH